MFLLLNIVRPPKVLFPVIQENPKHQTTEPLNKHHICVLFAFFVR